MTTVDLTQFFPYTFLLHLARALITFTIVHSMLKDKYNAFVTLISIVGVSMTYSYITLSFTIQSSFVEEVILFLYYIIQVPVVMAVTQGSTGPKILSVVFSFLTSVTSSILFIAILSLFVEGAIQLATTSQVDLVFIVFYSLFIYLFSFVTAGLIALFQRKRGKIYKYKTNKCYYYLFPITHIACTQLMLYIEMLTAPNISEKDANIIQIAQLIFSAVCFVLDFSILFIIDHLEKTEAEKERFNEELTKNKLDYNKFLALKEEREGFRKIRHDIANILTTTKGFIEIEEYDKALKVLNGTTDDLFDSTYIPICNNETINTIIAIKTKEAKQNDVLLKVDVKQHSNINVSDYDLCRLINNILDNAINAVTDTQLDKEVYISIYADESTVHIKSKNQFDKSKSKAKVHNSFHGYGQKIIREITQKYNGSFDISTEQEYYLTKISLANSTPPPNLSAEFVNAKFTVNYFLNLPRILLYNNNPPLKRRWIVCVLFFLIVKVNINATAPIRA